MSVRQPEVTWTLYRQVFEVWLASAKTNGYEPCVQAHPEIERALKSVEQHSGPSFFEGEKPISMFCHLLQGTGILSRPTEITIKKSNYLHRRLYKGQAHRTVKCPTHDGEWSGIGDLCICGMTGWLPPENRTDIGKDIA